MDSNVKTTIKKMKKVQHEITLSRRLLTNSYNIDEVESIKAEIRKKQSMMNKLKVLLPHFNFTKSLKFSQKIKILING